MDFYLTETGKLKALLPSLVNAPAPPTTLDQYPAWSAAVTHAITGIFDLMVRMADELEALETRVAELEAGTASDSAGPPQGDAQ